MTESSTSDKDHVAPFSTQGEASQRINRPASPGPAGASSLEIPTSKKDPKEARDEASERGLRTIPPEERLVPDDFQLDATERAIARACQVEYPGYPPIEQRLRMGRAEIEAWIRDGMPAESIRDDKSTVLNHPNRPKGLELGLATVDDGQQAFEPGTFEDTYDPKGNRLDSRGVPVHPYAEVMLQNGAVSGPGFYWKYGPNRTADPVVIRQKEGRLQVLVVKRADTGNTALPGGMQDKGEPDFSTALRELEEETGANLNKSPRVDIYRGVVADPRATLNAWPEAAVVLIMPDDETAESLVLKPGDDAEEAFWMVSDSRNIESMFASHGDFTRLAILEWQKRWGLVVDKDGVIGLPSNAAAESE